jgi:hypothetical protein
MIRPGIMLLENWMMNDSSSHARDYESCRSCGQPQRFLKYWFSLAFHSHRGFSPVIGRLFAGQAAVSTVITYLTDQRQALARSRARLGPMKSVHLAVAGGSVVE